MMTTKTDAAGGPVDGWVKEKDTEGQEEIEFKLERDPERLSTVKPRVSNT